VAEFINGFSIFVIQNPVYQLSNYRCLYEIFHVIPNTIFVAGAMGWRVKNDRMPAFTYRSWKNGVPGSSGC
jgi:hypothetical protein